MESLFSRTQAVKFSLQTVIPKTTPSSTLIISISLLVLSAFNYGFSDQAFATTQAMNSFIKEFGEHNVNTNTYAIPALFTSLYNSLKAGGQIVGIFVGSWVSNRYGRRWCIFSMNIYALVTSSIVVSSHSGAQILAGRSLHYAYLGMQMSVIPTTLAELAPANVRGGTGVLYWLSIKIGGLVVTSVCRRTASIETNWAWRLPFSLFLVVPTIVASLVWFIPESPRWLLFKSRPNDATVALKRLRRDQVPEVEIQRELDNLAEATSPQQQASTFADIFTLSNRKLTWIVILVNFFQQATGQAFASQFGTLFVKSLKTLQPFSITIATNAIDIGALLICLVTSDVLGRRFLLVVSAAMQTGALMIMGALGSVHDQHPTVRRGIVGMLLVYSFAWSVGWAPLTYVISTELPSASQRENTLRVAYTVKLVMEFLVTFTYPYLENDEHGKVDLGGRLGFIYGSLAICAVIFAYFFVPETSQLELEEINHRLQDNKTPSGRS